MSDFLKKVLSLISNPNISLNFATLTLRSCQLLRFVQENTLMSCLHCSTIAVYVGKRKLQVDKSHWQNFADYSSSLYLTMETYPMSLYLRKYM